MIRDISRSLDDYVSRSRNALARHPRAIVSAIAALLLLGSGLTFAVANLAPDPARIPIRSVVEPLPVTQLDAQSESLQSLALRLYRSEVTRSADTAETLLRRLGVFDPKAAAFIRNDRTAHGQLLNRAGRRVSAEVASDNSLLKLQVRWVADDDGSFKRLTIEKQGAEFIAQVEVLPLVATTRLASGTIFSSLFAATDDARVPDSIAIQMAEIFSSEIDFHRALRKGDAFSVVYETLEGDGEPLSVGRVLSTEFVNNGKTHQAMWFQEPASTPVASNGMQATKKGGYYTLAGESLRHAFLAAPLEFSRVTSGFKMRFHPILREWRAHLGVDYAAPIGTAVRSVGDGKVEFAGVQNGFGNVVKIKHQGEISTVYAHLSRINVRAGQAVEQGQNIGEVGMTGWATGPHLHFEYRVNGQYQDPQAIAQRNQAVPLATAMRPLFEKAAAEARLALAAAAQNRLSRIE